MRGLWIGCSLHFPTKPVHRLLIAWRFSFAVQNYSIWISAAEESLSVIDNEAVPTSRRISEEISLILERNRIDVLFGGRFPDQDHLDRHYGQV